MMLCDLDEIKICVDRQYENCHGYSGNKKAIYREAILAVKSILHSAKAIDAVPVVRCEKCKHWLKDVPGCTDCVGRCELANYMVGATGYCVYGERRVNHDK